MLMESFLFSIDNGDCKWGIWQSHKEGSSNPTCCKRICISFSLQWWGGLFWLDELIGELIFDLIGEL